MEAPENFDDFMAEMPPQFTTYFKHKFYAHITSAHQLFEKYVSFLPAQLTTFLSARFYNRLSTTQELFSAFIVLSILLLALLSLLISRISWTSLASLHLMIFLAVLPFIEIPVLVTVEILTWSFLGLGVVKEVGGMLRWVSELMWWPGRVICAAAVYVVAVRVAEGQWGPWRYRICGRLGGGNYKIELGKKKIRIWVLSEHPWTVTSDNENRPFSFRAFSYYPYVDDACRKNLQSELLGFSRKLIGFIPPSFIWSFVLIRAQADE
ncbi:hypothetical protein BDZ45DRAFT_803059 [Acephala macrosclerotiorum]|nr:hypothetical protein BDZ45DRAFT_803059 [Acephala macrosclerotiorum]